MASPDSGRKVKGGRLTPVRRRMLDRLFDQALEQTPEERADFVERCARRAPHLGFWLKRLLMASAQPTGFIDHSARHMAAEAVGARSDLFPTTLVRGTRFGPWRILARIGAGGMGEVYQAERADGAFEMKVAIKLIRSRKKNLARLLESERQLMARLNHGSIARLIDGGLAEDGRPYLVMEWVDGRTLGEWAPQSGIMADRYLSVFARICEAVAFAHRSLVVHGDIKPANLAISRDGQVKLLDFGVAQLLDGDGEDRMPSALTPGFAAPEQLDGQPISTASDIYSLGALLHWLVFGKAPGQSEGRPQPRPGWRGYRRLADLEAMIEVATAKDPEQRYATVNALLMELERLSGDFPVKARALPPWTRSGLWVRRRKMAAALGGLTLVCALAGMSAVLWQARIVAQERDVARHEAAISLAVKDHLVLLFREVSSLSDDGRQMTARELLDATAEAASSWLVDEPETQAEVQLAIAEILLSLEDFASAEPLLERILGRLDESASPALTAKLYRNMAMVLHRRGEIGEGYRKANQAVSMIEGFSGDHRERLSDALQIRARLARERGNWQAAADDLRRARDLALEASDGPRPTLARAEANLAANYLMGGDFHAAVRHMEAAEALWIVLGRAESPDAMSNMHNLAVVLDRLGRVDQAEQRFRVSIRTRSERFGGSGALAAAKLQLARLLVVRGDYEEAEELMNHAARMMERFVGRQSPDFAGTQIGLGELNKAQGHYDLAVEYFDRAQQLFLQSLGAQHPYTLLAGAEKLSSRRRVEELDPGPAYQELLDKLEDAGPGARTWLAQVRCERAIWQLEQRRFEQGRHDAERCYQIRSSQSLGGWRLDEAQALMLLAEAASGSMTVLPELNLTLARLASQMAPDHSRYRWLADHAEALVPAVGSL